MFRGRRKRKAYLVLSLLVCAAVYLNIQLNNIAAAYTKLAQQALSKALAKEVVIDRVKSGFFANIILDGIKIGERTNGKFGALVSAKRLLIDFTLLDILMRRFDKERPVRISAEDVALGAMPAIRRIDGLLEMKEKGVYFRDFNIGLGGLALNLDGAIYNKGEAKEANFTLSAKNRYVDGALSVKGPADALEFKGRASFFAKYAFNFTGRTNYDGDTLVLNELNVNDFIIRTARLSCDESGLFCRLEPQEGSINLRANFKNIPVEAVFYKKPHLRSEYLLNISLDHAQLGDYNIVTELTAMGEAVNRGGKLDYIDGTLFSSNTIINYKPFKEVSCHFRVDSRAAYIDPFKFSENYILNGRVGLARPYDMELVLSIRDADTQDLIVFGKQNGENPLSGKMSGELRIAGPLDRLKSKGHLESFDGNVGAIKYNSAVINLEGRGMVFTVKDSRLIRDKGFLIMDGEIDLRDIGRPDILRNLKVRSDEHTLVLEGWDISAPHGSRGLDLQKRVGEEFKVNFKTYVNDETKPGDVNDREVELGYKLKGNKELKMKLKEKEEAVSVEQKVKF